MHFMQSPLQLVYAADEPQHCIY